MTRTILTILGLATISLSCKRVQPKSAMSDSAVYFSAVRDLMHSVVSGGDSTDPLILEDSVPFGGVYEGMDMHLRDSTLFTKQEGQQILAQAAHPAFRVWTAGLLGQAGNVRIIRTDTINAYFRSGDLDGGWDYVYKHVGHDLNNFGCPLFFRNYTWCVLYSDHECGGLCGSGSLKVYKKRDGRWVLVKEWGLWIS